MSMQMIGGDYAQLTNTNIRSFGYVSLEALSQLDCTPKNAS